MKENDYDFFLNFASDDVANFIVAHEVKKNDEDWCFFDSIAE